MLTISPERAILGTAVAAALCGGLVAAAPGPAQAVVHREYVAGTRDATIRNGPAGFGSGYVIGAAKTARPPQPGVAFDPTGVRRKGYRYGLVHGNFKLCAWLAPTVQTTAGRPVPDPRCPGGNAGRVLSVRRFMYLQNGKPLRNCEPGHCSDGSKADVRPLLCAATYPGGVPAYGNVRPWRPTAEPSDQYATIKATSYRVYWRYVSRDGKWVMVHDHHRQRGAARRNAGFSLQDAKWFFVPRDCVFDTRGRLH